MKYKKILAVCLIFASVLSIGTSFCSSKYNAAYGQEMSSNNAKEDKLYGIGSVSKVYTAAAVMKLVDEGKVNLDDPVTKYIPDFQMADERYKNITVRMLLNHSSGLNGGTSCNTILLNDNSTYNHDNLLNNLKEQTLKADPGEFSVYCNDGFTLAEILVERISGISFTQFLEENFYKKLEIKNTKTPENAGNEKFAVTYFNNTSFVLPRENANVIGSGGIYSTPEDMCKFAQVFMKDNKNNILSTESVNALMKDETEQNKYGAVNGDSMVKYGLGWDTVEAYPFNKYKIKALTKGGDTNEYHGALTVLPDKNISASVLSSGGSSLINELIAQQLIESVLKEENIIDDYSKYKNIDNVKEAEIPKEIMKNDGLYCSDKMFKVDFKDNKLIISTLDDETNITQEYIYTKDGYFVSTNKGYISCEGEITSSQNGSVGNTKLYFKKEDNKTYIYIQSYENYPGLGDTAAAIPFGQKIEKNAVRADVMKVWKKRNNKKYYLVNETYTSTFYLLKNRNHIKISLSDNAEGYLKNDGLYKNNMIVNENYAKDFVKIPGMIGRDTNDFEFYKSNGVEYLKLPTVKDEFICEDAIKDIDFSNGDIEISNNATKWFNISKAQGNKEISIKIKGNGSYFIYDKYDNCIDTSVIQNKKTKITLPEEGKIALAGETGTKFKFD